MNYLVEGRVIPERVDITTPAFSFVIKHPQEASCSLQIIRSKIFINIKSDGPLDVPSVRNALFGVVGDVVNQIGFRLVIAVSCELESISCIEERWTEVFSTEGFVFGEPSDFENKITFKPQPFGELEMNVDQLHSLAITRAFLELRNAIRYPDFTALHCRLAMEAMRNHFGDRKDQAWRAMRGALHLQRVTIDSFKIAADCQRHGRNLPQSWEQRRDAMKISWEVCHRFLVWLGTDGDQPLDEKLFPLF